MDPVLFYVMMDSAAQNPTPGNAGDVWVVICVIIAAVTLAVCARIWTTRGWS